MYKTAAGWKKVFKGSEWKKGFNDLADWWMDFPLSPIGTVRTIGRVASPVVEQAKPLARRAWNGTKRIGRQAADKVGQAWNGAQGYITDLATNLMVTTDNARNTSEVVKNRVDDILHRVNGLVSGAQADYNKLSGNVKQYGPYALALMGFPFAASGINSVLGMFKGWGGGGSAAAPGKASVRPVKTNTFDMWQNRYNRPSIKNEEASLYYGNDTEQA